jgi:soluble lytic murein transglycosylase
MSREHILAPHRMALIGLVVVLGLVTLAATAGPAWYKRLYYPVKYTDLIGTAAKSAGLDPYLLTAVVHSESEFDPGIVSRRGAVGLVQVMPETANDIMKGRGIKTKVTMAMLKEPAFNLQVGADFLAQLIRRYHGDWALALAAYNAGTVNADRWAKGSGDSVSRIGFPTTQRYVATVLKERDTYQRLYPEVFR